MTGKIISAATCLFIIFCFVSGTVLAEEPEIELSKKEKIIVFPFTEPGNFGYKVGQAVADTIITELINMGRFEVADRVNIEKIMKEQTLGLSGLMSEENAVEVGNLLGAKTSIMGSVTGFNVGRNKKEGYDGTLTVDIKVVDVETSRIEKAATLGVSASIGASKTVSDSTLRETVRKKLLKKVSGKFFHKMRDYFSLKTYIMTIKGRKVSIRMGKDMGIKKNFRFDAVRKGAEVKDPVTGEILEVKTDRIAHIWVTKVDNKISYGRVTSGKGTLTPGTQLVEVPTLNVFTSITGGIYPFVQEPITTATYDDGPDEGSISFNFNKLTHVPVIGFESGKQSYWGTTSLDFNILIGSPILGLKITAGGLFDFIRLGPVNLGIGARLGGFGAFASLGKLGFDIGQIPRTSGLTAACIGFGGEILARLNINFSRALAFSVNCGYALFTNTEWGISASWGEEDSAAISTEYLAQKPDPLKLQGLILRAGFNWSF